jgi:hypothetical protein
LQTLSRDLFDSYDSFKINGIESCRFTQAEMLKWFRLFEEQKLFTKTALGISGEGRAISLYSIGSGFTKVLLWSQMHGDEPTATMALADIFSFFAKNPEHTITKTICNKLTLLVIPMLNPDGAERFIRRTAQLIDMNRDALVLETPEANILKATRDRYHPEYGFNLHDQDSRFTVGTTKKITAIALLAPSANAMRIDDHVRIRAKKAGSVFAQILNQFIPGHLAKWDDTFEPRAFGDNMQKWGTSTLLVESGGWHGDPEKFFIRKLNCIALLATMYTIAIGENANADVAVYEDIPFNMKLGCDIILRNAVFKANDRTTPVLVDVGINIEKCKNNATGQLESFAMIIDMGDLSNYTALGEDVDTHATLLDASRMKMDHPFSAAEIPLLLKRT